MATKAVNKTTDPNELGKQAFAKNDFEGAIQHFTTAIEKGLKKELAYSNRAACYISLSKSFDAGGSIQILTNAINDADEAIKLNKKYIKAYVRKGTAQLQLKKFAEAKKTFETGLKIDVTDKALHDGLATATKLLSQQKQSKKQAKEPLNSKDVVVGIDLGTTYSCISFWHAGQVVIIPNDRGDMTTPSYVSFTKNNARAVGMAAKLEAPRNPVNTVFDVKRFIGSQFDDSGVQQDISRYPYKVVESKEGSNKPAISITTEGNTTLYQPEEISAMVLSYLKRQAEAYLKGPVKKAVITVPAYFNDSQRAATKTAGEIAGLDVLRIINEPTAAALAYGLDRKSINASEEAARVLIFDLGGGTFDVSVLTIENGVFTVKATGGDTRLGGEDIDRCVADLIWKHLADKGFPQLSTDPRSIKRVMHAVEKAKRELSSVESVDIVVEGLAQGPDGKPFDLEYPLTRAEFEAANKNLFARCLDTVQKVLKDADMPAGDIDDIVLVGGSTRIPKLQTMLIDFFGGKQLCKTLNPDEAVAYGAAVQGAILSGQRSAETANLLLLDVTPLSLGIETIGRVMSVIIPRNTPIPCTRTEVYTTESDYQTAVDVAVYEGERPKTTDNHLLGDFNISGIERAKRGEPKVDVTFELDSNGMLTVTAIDQTTGAKADIQIARGSRASQAEIEKMRENAEQYRAQDEEVQKAQKLRADLESRVYDLQGAVDAIDAEKYKNMTTMKVTAQKKINEMVSFLESRDVFPSEILTKKLAELALLGKKLRA